MNPTTTQSEIEQAVQDYIDQNRDRMEYTIRSAFLAGYGEGLEAARKIYLPKNGPTPATLSE